MQLYRLFSRSRKLSLKDKLIINKYNNVLLVENEKSCDFDGKEEKTNYNSLKKSFNTGATYNKKDDSNLVEQRKDERVITKLDQNSDEFVNDVENNKPPRNFQVIVGNKKNKDLVITKKNKQIYNRGKIYNRRYGNNANPFITTIDDIYARIKFFILEIFKIIKF